MKYITLEQKLRATSVARWHIVKTAVPQSLSDHLFSVAMIAECMLSIFTTYYVIRSVGFYRDFRAILIDKALHHDQLEVLTGDIPSPYKKWLHRQGYYVIEPKHLTAFDDRATDAGDYNDLLNALIKLSDALEAFHFINRYAIDDHGRLAASRLYDRLLNANEWMPKHTVPHRVIGDGDGITGHGFTHTGGPVMLVGNETCVDWSGFAQEIYKVMTQRPEEISDDDALEGGPIRGVDRSADIGDGWQSRQNREQAAPRQRGPAIQPRRQDGSDRDEGDDLLHTGSENLPETSPHSGSAQIPKRTREEIQSQLRGGIAQPNEPRISGSDTVPVE